MAGEKLNVDVRSLDALGTPLHYDQDPRGSVRLASQPGNWQRFPGNPVMHPDPASSWESQEIFHPHVIYNGTRYEMWYVGFDGNTTRIGYATSEDGVHWTRYEGNPILEPGPPGSWDENRLLWPYVLFDGTLYKMWYTSVDGEWVGRIGYATSTDGINWVKSPENPVLDLGELGSWDSWRVGASSVIYDGYSYKMWYIGADSPYSPKVGLATSTDGIHWTKYQNNPVLEPGPPGSWDQQGIIHTNVLFDGISCKMWYAGFKDVNMSGIGYATSLDGIHWIKHSSNPILEATPGTWEEFLIGWPNVLFDGGHYRMWYQAGLNRLGTAEGENAVGYAAAPPIYQPFGYLISTVFDAQQTVRWQSISWTATEPKGTSIVIEVRVGNTPAPDASWSQWHPVSNGGALQDLTSRYIQYKATLFSHEDLAKSPVLHDITLIGEVVDGG